MYVGDDMCRLHMSTASFYRRDLSMLGFLVSVGFLEPIPICEIKNWLLCLESGAGEDVCTMLCHEIEKELTRRCYEESEMM